MKIAAIQMNAGDDVEKNVERAFFLVDRAEADLIVLPEVFSHVTRGDDGTILSRVREKAAKIGRWIAGSLLLEKYNTAFLVDPNGDLVAQYRKIHLFDVPGLNTESDYTDPGNEIVTAEVNGFRIGFAICYDLRFPEMFRELESDIYLVPSAFTAKTGRDHWETLVRARAIENLAYVVAPNQEGMLPVGVEAWGHSMIVDPWGKIVAEASHAGVIEAEVSRKTIDEIRKSLPALRHKKLPLD
jgi:nitrilase